jgi:hypothetical protein
MKRAAILKGLNTSAQMHSDGARQAEKPPATAQGPRRQGVNLMSEPEH